MYRKTITAAIITIVVICISIIALAIEIPRGGRWRPIYPDASLEAVHE